MLRHYLTLSCSIQAAASIDAFYEPILRKAIAIEAAPGFAALQIAIPNLTALPWEEIVSLREKDCLVAFRQKMIEVEQMAKAALPQGEVREVDYQISLFRTFVQELSHELSELQPKIGGVAGDVALDVVVGLIPLPGVSAFITGARGAVEVKEANQSWTAAFLKLANRQ